MYSKYLDYTEHATKSHREAQQQCDQRDVVISQLKNEVYELRQLEGDYAKLNDLIIGLEDKYSLLMSDKERSEKQQRVKNQIDKNKIIDLRGEIDDLRVHLQKFNLQIQELLRENSNMKRQMDSRSVEIQNIRFQIKEVENKNQRSNDQNKSMAISVKGLKQERKRLQEECEDLSSILDNCIGKLKGIEKEVRSTESINAKLEKTLYQAERDNNKLMGQRRDRNEDIKKAEQKLKSVANSIHEQEISYKNIEQQATRNRGDMEKNVGVLNNQLAKGKQLQGKINSFEANVRVQQNELDTIIIEEEKLRKRHFDALDKNKKVNGEIDKLLALIAEYELLNKELVDEIELYIDQDEQAKSMLSRKEAMRQIIEGSFRKIMVTEDPIRHLKC